MFLILITSQIVNLKVIGEVLVLIKCYQCGGETLGPVVKHSVSDSSAFLLGQIKPRLPGAARQPSPTHGRSPIWGVGECQ
jgi:hypothetical protein